MTNIKFIILLVLVGYDAKGQQTTFDVLPNTISGRTELFGKSYRDSSGVVFFEYYRKKDSTLFCTETKVNDKINGSKIWFLENGQIFEIRNYLNGIITGVYLKYYSNGQLEEKGEFIESNINSSTGNVFFDTIEIENVDSVGNISKKLEIEKFNSPKSGKWEFFYETGQLQYEGFYFNNLKEGIWKFYDSQRLLAGTRVFKKGILVTQTGNFSNKH